MKNGHDGHSLRLQDVHGLKWIQLEDWFAAFEAADMTYEKNRSL